MRYVPDELLVKVRPGQTLNSALGATQPSLSLASAEPSLGLPGLHKLKLPPGSDVEQAAVLLSQLPEVEYAEPNYLLSLAAAPNDPLYGSSQKWYYDLMNAPQGWDVERGDGAIIVAVLDSGIKFDHEDLQGNIWRNIGEIQDNGIDDDSNGYTDDVFGWNFYSDNKDPADDTGDGHGTFVSGIIGARTDNSTGVAGVAWNVRIMPLKVIGSTGEGIEVANVIEAINYAAANGARIINMSLANSDCNPIQLLREAVQQLPEEIIVVAAAGNLGLPCVPDPAGDPRVIAVGASAGPFIDQSCETGAEFDSNRRAVFSDGGSNYGQEIDLAAPGQCIASTSNDRTLGLYAAWHGTSFSAPLVSGLVALLLSQNATRTDAHILAILCATAVDMPDGETPNWDGCGRIDIGRALTQGAYQSIVPGITRP
jgi:subtilisin family serine protease